MKRYLYRLLQVIVVLLALSSAACTKKVTAPKPQARPVSAAKAVTRDIPIYIDSFGTLAACESIDIKSQVTGKIISFLFKEGQFVNKGDLLFVIDTNTYIATLQKEQASLAQSAANLQRNKDSYDRNKKLWEQKVISDDEFERYKTAYDDTVAQYMLAQAQLRLAQLDLDYCTIESPVSGYTGRRLVDPGNIVPANTGPTLVNVKRIDNLLLDFTASEKYFHEAHLALASNTIYALLSPEGVDGVFTGIVHFVDNTVDDQTGTIAFRADVPNKDFKLWPGQFITIKFVVGEKKNAVLVPYTAVQNGQKGAYAFVVSNDSKADLRNVTTGLRYDDMIMIASGIKAGETVVTVGQMGLAPGTPVSIVPQKETP